MALIKNAQIKNSSGGYDRLFGHPRLGQLISRIQSTVISAGTELERIISEKIPNTNIIDDLDKFLDKEIMPNGVFLARKNKMKKSQKIKFAGAEPDFMIFKRQSEKQKCHIIELKDGHVFDTKKAAAEQKAMHDFIQENSRNLQYKVLSHFCAFNQKDRNKIWEGFKKKIKLKEAMTGPEFCELLEIDYESIVEKRKVDGKNNTDYFLSELIKIDSIKDILKKKLA